MKGQVTGEALSMVRYRGVIGGLHRQVVSGLIQASSWWPDTGE